MVRKPATPRVPPVPTPPAPAPGDAVSPFEAADEAGNRWSLREALGRGHVLLVTVRGSWCFLTRRQLAALRELAPELAELGCSIAALGMEPPDRLQALKKRTHVPFPLLADERAEVLELLRLPIDRAHACPFPAAILIAPGGTIVRRHVGRKPRDWPDWLEWAEELSRKA